MNFFRVAFAICTLIAISSCSGSNVSYNYPNNVDVNRKARSGNFMSKSWLPFADKSEKKTEEKIRGESVGSHTLTLWQASAQVIGEMFPISVVDKDSGIIATEWYQETPESIIRLKINVLVRSKDNTKDSLRVSVFQQKRIDGNSPWQGSGLEDSESVANSTFKAKKIKDHILNRANAAKKSSPSNE